MSEICQTVALAPFFSKLNLRRYKRQIMISVIIMYFFCFFKCKLCKYVNLTWHQPLEVLYRTAGVWRGKSSTRSQSVYVLKRSMLIRRESHCTASPFIVQARAGPEWLNDGGHQIENIEQDKKILWGSSGLKLNTEAKSGLVILSFNGLIFFILQFKLEVCFKFPSS